MGALAAKTTLPIEKKERIFTYADYKEWDLEEGERFELIYGEAYAMASPNERHQAILTELLTQFQIFLRGKPCKVYPAPFDVRLFYEEDESDDTVVQPDIMVICDEKKRGHEGCRGAPDLVVEILSPSNMAIEMERKFNLYRKAGVQEYWVVDPENQGLTVYHFKRDTSSERLGLVKLDERPQDNTIFTYTYRNTDTVPVAVLPGLTISLEQAFAE
jgi:Uma2 family endonuclease